VAAAAAVAAVVAAVAFVVGPLRCNLALLGALGPVLAFVA
jgi:hypothetical protein